MPGVHRQPWPRGMGGDTLGSEAIAPRRPGRRDASDTPMAKTFGFNDDELKLLLVAVRQMRRTFAQARQSDESIEAYAALYDELYEKLRDMAGPLPEQMDELL